MITPTHLAAVEDALHLLNPLRLKENLRHLQSGVFSPRTYQGLNFKKAGGVRKGLGMFLKDMGHTIKGGFWDLPFKGTAIMTLPFTAYAASQAPDLVNACPLSVSTQRASYFEAPCLSAETPIHDPK